MEKRKRRSGAAAGGQRQDVMSKEVFGNHELCAQFLRDYIDLPFLKNVQAEDIEKFDERYHFFDAVELNSDTVKKVRLRGSEAPALFIALIEHKSSPDYDVAMQLLQYMTCIWYNWAKTEKERLGAKWEVHRRESFRYPPILPIVYYEGAESWADAPELKDRILLHEEFPAYIPNFRYFIIRNRDYTDRELLERGDEISLIMLLNKIQGREDLGVFRDIPPERLEGILGGSSGPVLDVMAGVVQGLCRRLNMPDGEASRYVEKVKEGEMGYFWENMEPIDIQAIRREENEAVAKRDQAVAECSQAEEKRDRAVANLDHAIADLEQVRTECSQAEEKRNQAVAECSQAEEKRNQAVAECSQAEEKRDQAVAECSQAEAELIRLKEELAMIKLAVHNMKHGKDGQK